MDDREKEIQSLCEAVLNNHFENTGDHGAGGRCSFCYKECAWNADAAEMKHEPDCVVLVAKDLSTK